MIELDYVKKHLRIEHNEEDELLSSYTQSAEEIVQIYLNQTFEDILTAHGSIPHSIRNAVCMLVGSMYRDREATSTTNVITNPVVVAMLKPFKKILR